MSHREAMKALRLAQAGDDEAKRQVALHVYDRYSYRIQRLYTLDPAISHEDMLATFFEGILRAIPELDARGNPLYFAGQRGVWAVQSEVRAVAATMERRSLRGFDDHQEDGLSLSERIADRCEPELSDMVISTMEADDAVRIVTGVALSARARQAARLVLDGAVDPDEPGFNRSLARTMGVSPQRASQVVAELRKAASDEA